MSKGMPVTREAALSLIPRIERMLDGKIDRMLICGSLRRGHKDIVNDIDIVVIKSDFWDTDRKSFTFEVEGVQVDINLTTEESWGASILMWTGTKELNVKMRAIAKERGFKLSQYGLFDRETNKRVAGRTEEEMFKALGLKFLPPEKREIGWHENLERLESDSDGTD